MCQTDPTLCVVWWVLETLSNFIFQTLGVEKEFQHQLSHNSILKHEVVNLTLQHLLFSIRESGLEF